ncbi:hypothetical protein WL14_09345 [Burkholderia cepacia]|nr:hypothetical protein WJ46_30095 [Burkholderia cepacia]KVQ33693.1 hypothetical protein WK02_09385 [Burkholderia cepacia]KVZ26394.1 hypothetical protein WL14_09345 [Burkholderia cepacia]
MAGSLDASCLSRLYPALCLPLRLIETLADNGPQREEISMQNLMTRLHLCNLVMQVIDLSRQRGFSVTSCMQHHGLQGGTVE